MSTEVPPTGVTAGLAPYIMQRRTNREPFSDERVPDQVRAELDLRARIEGAVLQWLDRPPGQWWLQMATKEADQRSSRAPKRPQAVIHFGCGLPVPPTPRRSIADLLIRD